MVWTTRRRVYLARCGWGHTARRRGAPSCAGASRSALVSALVQCTALSPEYSPHIYSGRYIFSATGSLILTQQILTCTYRYHCIVHVPAYSRTGREVYTVRSYTKALQHVAGTWPSLLRAWARNPGRANLGCHIHTRKPPISTQ